MNSTQKTKVLYDACVGKDWEGVTALCRCEAKSEGTSNFKATYQDERGRTCLHIAVIKNAPCGVVRAIIDAHKECPVPITRLTDNDERTALHFTTTLFVCRNDAAVLQLLVESDPHCATMPDKYGRTPLHNIATTYYRESRNKIAMRVACVRALLNASTPESILPPDSYKHTALHAACSCRRTSPEIVRMILQRCPQAALATNSRGDTPLHSVARRDLNCAKITSLLESLTTLGQSGAAAVNNDGRTPLHIAICVADKLTIKLLIDSQPQSVCINDKEGMTPLDCLQVAHAQRALVLWRKHELRSLFKESCEKSNMLAETMLTVRHRSQSMTVEKSLWISTEQKSGTSEELLEHAFMHNYLRLGSQCPLYFILDLKKMYPHQTQMKDARGDLPLHIALENGVQHAKFRSYLSLNRKTVDISSYAVIKELIDAYPQAAKVPNRNGDLPFHLLLQNRADESGWYYSVHPVLRAHPAALCHERTDLPPVLLPLILEKLGDEHDLPALYEIVKEMPSLCFEATETTTLDV